MILDNQNIVSRSQALTTGTIVSTDTIDLSQARDIGAGEVLEAFFNCDTTFATLTSVQFQVITSAAANLSSPTVIETTAAIPVASLVAGAQFVLPLARQLPSLPLGQRFLGVQYVIVGTGTGSVTAAFVLDYQDRPKHYSNGFAIA